MSAADAASAADASFYLSNYRLGKTLGVGSFGKVRWEGAELVMTRILAWTRRTNALRSSHQVKVAEHILTGHR
jgi:hypothetical protein